MNFKSERHQQFNRRRYFKPRKKKAHSDLKSPKNQPNVDNLPILQQSQEISDENFQDFSKEEQRIFDLGKGAFNQALEYYFFPSLPLPKFIFDYSQNTGFHINFNNYQITLNLANTPNIFLDHELHDYFHSLSLHEIGHYVYCPYDNQSNLKLLSTVIQNGVNKHYAPIILNIFADLLIDYRNHKEFPKLMEWELDITIKHIIQKDTSEQSQLWKLLVHAYEIMWNISILPTKIDISDVHAYAERISEIILKDIENDTLWETKVKKIARLLKDFLKKECKVKDTPSSGRANVGSDGKSIFTSPIEVPNDVAETFGSLTEIHLPDFVKNGDNPRVLARGPDSKEQLLQSIEDLSPNLDYATYRDVLTLNGFQDSIANLASWYRGQAKNLLEIQIYQKKEGGSIPFTPSTWRIGDPIEDLDPTLSLLTSPIIIPNITTRKWEYKKGPGQVSSQVTPDLLIVLDSSGSMDWNFNSKKITGRYHTAVMAAFSALHYVNQKGAYCAGINFSDHVKTAKWTNQISEVENLILSYQGYGTVLPITQIEKLTQQNEYPCLILLISDLEIDNWESVKDRLLKILRNHHRLIGFFIEGDPEVLNSSEFDELRQTGANFYVIQKESDLVGLVIKEIQQIYSPEKKLT